MNRYRCNARNKRGSNAKRGLHGPASAALAFLAWLPLLACANSTELQLDLSGPISMPAYRATLQAMAACEPVSLTIHYAFGDLALTVERANQTCQLQVAIQGELDESEEPAHYRCPITTLGAIDWLHEEEKLRDGPPLGALSQRKSCIASVTDSQ
jgi:hypothetical protein